MTKSNSSIPVYEDLHDSRSIYAQANMLNELLVNSLKSLSSEKKCDAQTESSLKQVSDKVFFSVHDFPYLSQVLPY